MGIVFDVFLFLSLFFPPSHSHTFVTSTFAISPFLLYFFSLFFFCLFDVLQKVIMPEIFFKNSHFTFFLPFLFHFTLLYWSSFLWRVMSKIKIPYQPSFFLVFFFFFCTNSNYLFIFIKIKKKRIFSWIEYALNLDQGVISLSL